ncbi:MAG: peroxidase [Candidatus Binataceae bacterium]
MAWIKTVSEDAASGLVADTYSQWKGVGFVPNVVKAFSSRPELLELMTRTARTVTFGGSRLTRVQEEMIATVVSSVNRCHY